MKVRLNTQFAIALLLCTGLLGGAGAGLYLWSEHRTPAAREAKARRAVERAQKLYDAGDYAGADAAYTEACNLYGLVLQQDITRPEALKQFRELTLSLAAPSMREAKGWAMQHLIVARHAAQASSDPQARQNFYAHLLALAQETHDADLAEALPHMANDDLNQHPERTESIRYRGVGAYHLLVDFPWAIEQKQALFASAKADLEKAWRVDPADPVGAAHLALLYMREIESMPKAKQREKEARALHQKAAGLLEAAGKAHAQNLGLAVARAQVAYIGNALLGQPKQEAEKAVRSALALAQAQASPSPLDIQSLCEVTALVLTQQLPEDPKTPGHTEGQRAAIALAMRAAKAHDGSLELALLANNLAFAQAHAQSIDTLEHALHVPARLSVLQRLSFETRKAGMLALLAREQLNLAGISTGGKKIHLAASAHETLRQLRQLNRPELEPSILALEAQDFYLTGYYEQAAGTFDRALRLNPALGTPSLLRAAARAHALAQNLGSAQELMDVVMRLDGGSDGDHLMMANLLLQMGASEDLVAAQLSAIQKQDDKGVLTTTGNLAMRSGRFADAANAYGAADPLANLPKRTQALRAAGYFAQAKAEVDQWLAAGPPSAARTLLAALAVEPADREAILRQVERAGLPAKDIQEVRARLLHPTRAPQQKETAEEPVPAAGLAALAQWEKHDFKGFAKAMEQAEASKSPWREHPQILSVRIEWAMLRRDWDDARRLLERGEALRLHLPLGSAPGIKTSIAAMEALETGKISLPDAIANLRQVALDSPASADIWNLLANLMLADGQTDSATAAATFAARLQPHRGDRYQLLFQCMLHAGKFQEALQTLRDAHERLPFNDDLRELWLSNEEALGDLNVAYQARLERARTTPNDLHNALHLATFETRAGRTSQARTMLLQVAPRCAGDPELALAVCMGLARAGFPGDARTVLNLMGLPPAQTAYFLALLNQSLNASPSDQAQSWQAALNLESASARTASKAYGQALLDAGRTDDAIHFLQAFVKITPQEAPVRGALVHLLAQALIKAQHFDQALAVAQDLPKTPRLLLASEIQLARKNVAQAIRLAEEAADLDPADYASWIALGTALSADPLRHGDAVAAVQKAFQLDPWNPQARHLEASLDMQAGRYQLATRRLWRNLSLHPDDLPSFSLLTHAIFQARAVKLGHKPNALAPVQERAENPQHWLTMADRAMAAFQQARRIDWRMENPAKKDIATGYQTQAIRLSHKPLHSLGHLGALVSLGELINMSDAEKSFDLLERLDPKMRPLPERLAWRALGISQSVQPKQAEQVFQQAFTACEKADELTECLRLACLAYPAEKALQMGREALGKTFTPTTTLDFAKAALLAKQPQLARDALAPQTPALDTLGFDAPTRAQWLCTLADADRQLNDRDGAIALYQQAIALHPDDLGALHHLADLLLHPAPGRTLSADEAKEALRLIERGHFVGAQAAANGLMGSRQLAELQNTLALARARTGQADQAIALYQSALDIAPTAESHLLLGQLLAEQNRPAEARSHFADAARLAEAAGQTLLEAQAKWLLNPASFQTNLRYAQALAPSDIRAAMPLAQACLDMAAISAPEPEQLAECMRLCPQIWPQADAGQTRAKGLHLALEAAKRAANQKAGPKYLLLLAVAQAGLNLEDWEKSLDLALAQEAAKGNPWRAREPQALPLPALDEHSATRLLPPTPWPIAPNQLENLAGLLTLAPPAPAINRVFAVLTEQNLGHPDKALALALAQNGASITEWRLQAASLSALGRWQAAADVMGKVTASPKATSADRVRQLGLLQKLNQPAGRLRALATAALDQDATCYAARELLGDLALGARDYAGAIALYADIPVPAAPAAAIKRAQALKALGDGQKARYVVEDALVKCPADAWLLEAYFKMEPDPDLRQDAFRKACENGIHPQMALAFIEKWNVKLLADPNFVPPSTGEDRPQTPRQKPAETKEKKPTTAAKPQA